MMNSFIGLSAFVDQDCSSFSTGKPIDLYPLGRYLGYWLFFRSL